MGPLSLSLSVILVYEDTCCNYIYLSDSQFPTESLQYVSTQKVDLCQKIAFRIDVDRFALKFPWTNAYFLFCSSLPTEFMFDFTIILMCFPFEKAERLKHSIEISNAYEFFSGKLSDYRISFIQWNHMLWSTLNLCYIVRWEIQRLILSGIIWVTNYSLRILSNRVLI